MKRFILFTLVIGLFTMQANADPWELDTTTALGFTTYIDLDGSGGDDVGSLSVYHGPSTKVFGPGGSLYGAGDMSGNVGFVASFENFNEDPLVMTEINFTGTPTLSGTGYTGITSYVQNDNNSTWSVELWYEIDSFRYTSGFVPLDGHGGSAWLTTQAVVGLDLSMIDDIGFTISAYMDGKGMNPSSPDAFHISVVPVPVPAAVILGMLGLGVAGIKLRKYA